MAELLRTGRVRRWLVFAPLRVCLSVWPQEGVKWAPGVSMAVAARTPKQRASAHAGPAQIVVTNYESIQALTPEIMAGYDGIVFDELTKLKDPSGARFKHLDKLIQDINTRWGLTGSFTSNGLEDVFGQAKVVSYDILGRHKTKFLKTYFIPVRPEFSQYIPKADALPRVMERVKPYAYVLEPGEYKDKLPPLHVVEHVSEMVDYAPYRQMAKTYQTEIDRRDITAMTAAAMTMKLQQMASGFAYDENKDDVWNSWHKLQAVRSIWEENQRAPTLVVYNFVAELNALREEFGSDLYTLDATNAVDNWNAGRYPLMAIHYKSAGHGLNLQHGGNFMIWMSLPWSYEMWEQTVGRLHRGGQTKDVWCYRLTTAKTIETRMWERLVDRRDLASLVLEELALKGT
jgi:hypothetical protein